MSEPKICTIVINDEANARVTGLDPVTMREVYNKLNIFVPYAVHTPAYKMGTWDGREPYMTRGGQTFKFLLPNIIPIIEKAGYKFKFDDYRKYKELSIKFEHIDKDCFKDIKWPKGHKLEGQQVVLLDHQVDIINKMLDNHQGIFEACTSAGKTLVLAALAKKIAAFGRMIIVVPNKDLVVQTTDTLKTMGIDVGCFYGDLKEFGKQCTICTWQSLNLVYKAVRKNKQLTPPEIQHFADGVIAIVCDEAHTIKGKEVRKIFTDTFKDCPIRWGVTGTIPKDEYEKIPLLVSLGPTIGHLGSKELQDKGILAKSKIEIWQLTEQKRCKEYVDEIDYLSNNVKRMKWLGNKLKEISQSGNTLVLVNRVKFGEDLDTYLREKLGVNSVFIYGGIKSSKRKEEYKSINEENNKVIVATSQVASTGIDIPRLFNLVFIDSGKAFTRTMQSVGRGLRTYKDKDSIMIYDICSDMIYGKKHMKTRIKYYDENKHEHSSKVIDYMKEV